MDPARLNRLGRAALPVIAILSFVAGVGSVILVAGDTLGYDYQAYVGAADRLLHGLPLYDPNVDVAGPFAIYLYPPPFAVAFIPFALLPSLARAVALDRRRRGDDGRRDRDPSGQRFRPLVDPVAGRARLAGGVRDQARAGRTAAPPAVRPGLAAPAIGAGDRSGRRGGHAGQGSARSRARVGGAHRAMARGWRGASRSWRSPWPCHCRWSGSPPGATTWRSSARSVPR